MASSGDVWRRCGAVACCMYANVFNCLEYLFILVLLSYLPSRLVWRDFPLVDLISRTNTIDAIEVRSYIVFAYYFSLTINFLLPK